MNDLFQHFTQWKLSRNSNAVHVFFFLVASAVQKTTIRNGIPLNRGQLLTSRNRIARGCGLSERAARSALDKLIESGEVSRVPAKHGSILTIRDYDIYMTSCPTSCQGNRRVYQASQLRGKVHDMVDILFDRDEFTERKGVFKFEIPINCGGAREPRASFENSMGVEVRTGIEVVRKEPINMRKK